MPFVSCTTPKSIVRHPEGWPEPGPFVGREAVMRQFEQLARPGTPTPLEPISDFIDAADRVVVRFIWRGAGHGPESTSRSRASTRCARARSSYQEYFWDHAEALEAVGLSE